MHNQSAARAYQTVAKRTSSPRELEANLLVQAAQKLQRVRDNWGEHNDELFAALRYNTKLWGVFLQSVTRDDNPLPAPIRQNIANLGLFILKQCTSVETITAPERLDTLIRINRELAAGLRAVPAQDVATPPAA